MLVHNLRQKHLFCHLRPEKESLIQNTMFLWQFVECDVLLHNKNDDDGELREIITLTERLNLCRNRRTRFVISRERVQQHKIYNLLVSLFNTPAEWNQHVQTTERCFGDILPSVVSFIFLKPHWKQHHKQYRTFQLHSVFQKSVLF